VHSNQPPSTTTSVPQSEFECSEGCHSGHGYEHYSGSGFRSHVGTGGYCDWSIAPNFNLLGLLGSADFIGFPVSADVDNEARVTGTCELLLVFVAT
jgi:hypothetical protein